MKRKLCLQITSVVTMCRFNHEYRDVQPSVPLRYYRRAILKGNSALFKPRMSVYIMYTMGLKPLQPYHCCRLRLFTGPTPKPSVSECESCV